MDWTEGYASDIEYAVGFCREQSPAYLNFTCLLNGWEPVDPGKPFTYFELGFGRGLTVTVLAASNPQGDFYANDFNPAHVAGARELAASAQLPNLTLLENSFAELAAGKVSDLPQFDFITLQGIYTWVNAENRAHIVEFIRRYLKPGGIVYAGYNAMPGWSAALPMQRMLLEYVRLKPGGSGARIQEATAFVGRMNDAKADFFSDAPQLHRRITDMQCFDANYLVHEYLHPAWQPLYHADVARDMERAKLEFAGSCRLAFAFPELSLSPERQELLSTIGDPVVRETFKDYFYNTGFRKDVFVRGARRIPPLRQEEWLHRVGLALAVPREQVRMKSRVPTGGIEFDRRLYEPLLDALAGRPHSLAELAALPELRGQPARNLWQAAALLTAADQAIACFIDSARNPVDGAHRLNRALAAGTRHAIDYDTLASPMLGTGIATTPRERLIYLTELEHPQQQDPRVIAEEAIKIALASGRRMGANGKPYESEEECLAAVTDDVRNFLAVTAPTWRRLKII